MTADRTEPAAPTDAALSSTVMTSPIGELTVVASPSGVRAVLWPVDGELDRARLDDITAEPDSMTSSVLAAAVAQLSEYFAGTRTDFDVPLDPIGTDFQLRAWEALRSIDHGTTISYGEQAERLGDPRAARAVGAANGRNPISVMVPCHRVVGSDGSLTGFAGGSDAKRWLLDHEARVAGHRLV